MDLVVMIQLTVDSLLIRSPTGHEDFAISMGHLFLLLRLTKNPLAIVVWKPRVTDQRWKIQGDVLNGILPKYTVPTRVTH